MRLVPSTAAALLGCAILVGCSSSTTAPPAGAPPTDEPATTCEAPTLDHAVTLPLDGETTELECTMRALDEPLTDATVVCSAEYAHGVAETSLVHEALIRHLVVGAKFRTIAYEVDDATMRFVDAYVNDGDTAALDKYVKAAGSTLGNTKNMLALFEAFREMKLALPAGERLTVRGIDVAITQQPALDAVFAYLQQAEPSIVEEWKPKLTTKDRAAAREAATALRKHVGDHKADYVAKTDEASFSRCDLDLEALAEGSGFLARYEADSFIAGNAEFRDPAMSRNLLRIAADGSKTVVVTHIGHCAKDWPSSGLPRSGGFFAFGKAVHESLGDRYRVVAQIPGSGSELTIQGKTSAFEFSAKGLEKALSEAVEGPFALLPVRGSDPVNLDKAWPLERLPEENVKLGQQADVVAFIKTATPAKKNW